ncbi:MAG TPA: VWA domain-containing protein [Longimicrobiales bacterium]
MGAIDWTLYLVCAAALAGGALALYARREPGDRRRFLPAALRAASLALALLLLFDPFLPAVAAGERAATVVLLDDSRSMLLPDDDGTRWDAARAATRRTGADRVTLLSGAALDADALDGAEPAGTESRLLPALRAALETGARRVVLITDGGLTDVAEAARLLAGAGAALRVEAVGVRAVANVAVAAVDAPRAATAGDTLAVRVDVAALGMAGDSLRVALEAGGALLAEVGVMAPGDGRMASADVRMAVPAGRADGPLVVTARVARVGGGGADDFGADDARPFVVDVQARPRGVVLLSLRPDWEPRFLVPVLERSSGLPVRGYLRAAGGGYLTVGTGAAAARRVSEADVRADLERAAVVVLHGVGGAAPAWVRERLSHARLLLIPAPDAEPQTLPQPFAGLLARTEPGDWYVAEQAPASPVAPLMAQLSTGELPPLTSLRGAILQPGMWSPLAAQRDRRGGARPIAIAGTTGDRRWVVATGTGYWRWSLRGGESRRAYGLFWSALAGWLTEDLGADGDAPIRPLARVVELGAPVAWVVGGAADLVRIRVDRDTASLDTTVAVGEDRIARTAPLEAGSYQYAAEAGGLEAAGAFVVAGWSPEMVRGARDLASLSSDGGTVDAGAGSSRRLHASVWPWLLLVGLLCGEWGARRRLGLR